MSTEFLRLLDEIEHSAEQTIVRAKRLRALTETEPKSEPKQTAAEVFKSASRKAQEALATLERVTRRQ